VWLSLHAPGEHQACAWVTISPYSGSPQEKSIAFPKAGEPTVSDALKTMDGFPSETHKKSFTSNDMGLSELALHQVAVTPSMKTTGSRETANDEF
jgi:hypothetical protein